MGYIQQLEKKTERLTAAIRTLLENRGISDNTSWWTEHTAQQELEKLAESRTNYAVNSSILGITQEDDEEKFIFAVYRDDLDQFQELIQKELDQTAGELETKNIQLIFFVDDMRSQARLEAVFTKKLLQDMKARAKRTAGNTKRMSLTFLCILVRDYANEDVPLSGLKRYEMLQEPPVDRALNLETLTESPAPVQTLVFTVNLYRLVEIYNLVGDQLFQNNVRFGINETMGVDQSIRETLEREPELFWYKNNGVTLLVLDRQVSLHGTSRLVLGKLDPEGSPDFSVVNGAQTITTAARYFFRLEYEKERCQDPTRAKKLEEELERARENARVLVRVTLITERPGQEGQARQLANAISVALNRQKPIRIEDIAFTSPAVHKMAEYLRNQKNLPKLVRRGEGMGSGMELTLIEFVRARMACAGLPGAARNKSANELLRFRPTEDDPYAFHYRELFSDDWLDSEGEEETAVFNRDYRAVWFAHQTARDYDQCVKKLRVEDPELRAVVNNGKWYFTALVTQMANQFRACPGEGRTLRPDFSQFDPADSDVAEDYPDAIESFAGLVVRIVRALPEPVEINSNLFKNEKLYDILVGAMKQQYETLYAAPQEDPQPDNLAQLQRLAAQPAGGSRVIPGQSCVVLGPEIRPVSSDASAITMVAGYVLSNYAVKAVDLQQICGSWITTDRSVASQDTGYFRGAPRTVRVRDVTYWVGTSSNTAAKRRQMEALCGLAGVPGGEIEWYKRGAREFVSEGSLFPAG